MGKTVLHFFDVTIQTRLNKPGVYIYTREPLVMKELPKIAPTGYYTVVEVGDNTHMYYRGIEYEPLGNGRNIKFKDAWELTFEEVFEY